MLFNIFTLLSRCGHDKEYDFSKVCDRCADERELSNGREADGRGRFTNTCMHCNRYKYDTYEMFCFICNNELEKIREENAKRPPCQKPQYIIISLGDKKPAIKLDDDLINNGAGAA